MADIKTKPTSQDVVEFLGSVENETRREDGLTLLNLMEEITGVDAVMWGRAIVGFGSCHYKYASGREGDMPQVSFSPGKQNMTLYLRGGLESYNPLLNKLGKYRTSGGGCLYINKLSDVDLDVVREMVRQSFNNQH